MAEFDVDLLVIGAGSGGVRAARMAANEGAKVAVAEDKDLGGTCVNVGCVPKKLFTYAAHYAGDFEDAEAYGWEVGSRNFYWPRLIANKNTEIARLNGIYGKLMDEAGVTLMRGRATLTGPNSATVEGAEVTAKYILVATGGHPVVPEFPGNEHVITSDQAFHLGTLPGRLAMVGGGYIAVEFTSIFHALGVDVTQLYRGPLFLRGFDHDLREGLAGEMRKQGVSLRFESQVAKIEKQGKALQVKLEDGSALETDLVMVATGRAPNTKGLGLEAAGVELAANGAVKVDDHFCSNVPSVYALGDVIDRVQLTPVAIAEAMVVVDHMFGADAMADMSYDNIPSAVFSHPNLATVGLTEEEARKRHGEVEVYTSSFKALKHTLTGRDETTFMKLVTEPGAGRVLGLHMMGEAAGEIVQGFAVAMTCGATKAQFDATIGIHPTSAEEFVTLRTPRE
ncbi:MAG: glutathione-disulfide reductase [Alphaproteobacteria bacterium]|jgi:glutathione reductase (NADPH)|nr:glutathione-disulfide reductase [Alphaproteobacteria bacterium]MDP7543066.1 glutathione-disulfide reductase [Alphaproteobacteria bacterium]MDP7668971.1 glutathione-disulfide reductase [Alphaproteobacteria bacterium]MEE1561840.1 glutathione-disulfide reductase [Alphaproteobacteria bacterium]|tara:strand:+ start:25 stop:1380 length:1356 start_codon:yes stop_codon:yes gene_type:complete